MAPKLAGSGDCLGLRPLNGERRLARQVADRSCHLARSALSYFRLTERRAMSVKLKLTTTVSSKGQVILLKAIREQRQWPAGTELMVENTPDGVLLKARPVFTPARPKDVFGSLP